MRLLILPLLALLAASRVFAADVPPATLGAQQLAAGDADAAVKSFERAIELEPRNAEFYRQLGDACSLAAQKAGMLSKMSWAKKCRLAYEKAVELDPANLAARQSLMSFYQMAPAVMGGGSDKAFAQAAAIKEHDPIRGRLAYALLYIGEKKYPEARAELDAVLATEPENYAALFQTGRVAALSGEQLDRGFAALQRCLALAPTAGAPRHEAAHWRLGNLWEKKGDKPAARVAYQAALALNPKFQPAIDALEKLE